DLRDRLTSEFEFLSYATQVSSGMTPIPFVKNDQDGIALYEFIEGSILTAEEITKKEIDEAIKLFCLLNINKSTCRLSPASEACFTIEEHLTLINNRISTLQDSVREPDAEKLILSLAQYWNILKNNIIQNCDNEAIDPLKPLLPSEQCISPSDFGFHNALRMQDGTLKFLDFEYAGFDDPAKMIGDFFSQLAIPLKQEYFVYFVKQISGIFSDQETLIKRANLLRPLYKVKWCCIALNIFIPEHLARRKFANPNLNENSLKKAQLNKAENIIRYLETHYATH
ncbi:MAG TPA: hypothetical protein VHM20_06955, partial [Gammaproteobacteria bacterium]|nr:hypothetical protein [Gammaproteobacteria bacterium]